MTTETQRIVTAVQKVYGNDKDAIIRKLVDIFDISDEQANLLLVNREFNPYHDDKGRFTDASGSSDVTLGKAGKNYAMLQHSKMIDPAAASQLQSRLSLGARSPEQDIAFAENKKNLLDKQAQNEQKIEEHNQKIKNLETEQKKLTDDNDAYGRAAVKQWDEDKKTMNHDDAYQKFLDKRKIWDENNEKIRSYKYTIATHEGAINSLQKENENIDWRLDNELTHNLAPGIHIYADGGAQPKPLVNTLNQLAAIKEVPKDLNVEFHVGASSKQFAVAGKVFSEGGHWSKSDNTIRYFNSERLDEWNPPRVAHEVAHAQFDAIDYTTKTKDRNDFVNAVNKIVIDDGAPNVMANLKESEAKEYFGDYTTQYLKAYNNDPYYKNKATEVYAKLAEVQYNPYDMRGERYAMYKAKFPELMDSFERMRGLKGVQLDIYDKV